MKLPDSIYDVLKWICMVCIPAFATAYVALSKVWGWPLAQEISISANIICTLIGALIGISTAQYYKGE